MRDSCRIVRDEDDHNDEGDGGRCGKQRLVKQNSQQTDRPGNQPTKEIRNHKNAKLTKTNNSTEDACLLARTSSSKANVKTYAYPGTINGDYTNKALSQNPPKNTMV